jgi:hypothetical protein
VDSKQVFLCCEGQLVRGLRERGQAKEMGDLKERDGRPKGMGGEAKGEVSSPKKGESLERNLHLAGNSSVHLI